MPRVFVRSTLIIAVSCVVLIPNGVLSAASDEEAVTARLTEVGLAIERQIGLAQHNLERGTLDQATLERQAKAAANALESLERRIHSLPDGASDQLLTKFHAVRAQAANLARATELNSAPPQPRTDGDGARRFDRGVDRSRAAPTNDDCDNAFIVGFGSFAGDTSEATNDGEAKCGASLDSPDVWYRFVPPETGWVVIDTVNSLYDTVLSVHSDCPGTMANQIVCNDDAVGLQSMIGFHAYDSREYLIRVSGVNGRFGPYTLNIQTSGVIEGTVTRADTGAPEDRRVEVFDSDGYQVGSAYPDGTGAYSVTGLNTADYFVVTDGSSNLVDELWEDIPCPSGPPWGCHPEDGTPVPVVAGLVTGGIDFSLDAGAVITGTIVDDDTSTGIENARVFLYADDGVAVKFQYSNSGGMYRFEGLETGSYRVWAGPTTHFAELYEDIPCPTEPPDGCQATTGTPVDAQLNQTTTGIDFSLRKMATIAGRVTDRVSGLPIEFADIWVYDQLGDFFGQAESGADGNFEIGGMPNGTYFLMAQRWSDYVPQVFDGLDCDENGCVVTGGTPVEVTDQTNVVGIDFDLGLKGSIEGRVENAATTIPIQSLMVRVHNASGSTVGSAYTSADGTYRVDRLFAGTYFATTDDYQFVNEVYDDLPCPNNWCDPMVGTPVTVANGATTTGIDFDLVEKGRITGVVLDELGDDVYMEVRLLNQLGTEVADEYPFIDGIYEFVGVPEGTYFVLVDQASSSYPYLEELYDDIPCWGGPPGGCSVTDGTPVDVVSGAVTSGIDFTVTRKGSIAGSVVDAATSAPISYGRVVVGKMGGPEYAYSSVNSSGLYFVDGLIPGDHWVVADAGSYMDTMWDSHPCAAGYPDGCDLAAATPVAVAPESQIEGIDFSLPLLGTLGGVVRSAVSGAPYYSFDVALFAADGSHVETVSTGQNGNWEMDGIWPGIYYAATDDLWMFNNQLFDGIPCPRGPGDGCDPTTGTPIPMALNSVNRFVDFNLEPTGGISGRVLDGLTGLPVDSVLVEVWGEDGTWRRSSYTDLYGRFEVDGLEEGNFFVATDAFGTTGSLYLDVLYDGIPCPGGPIAGCDPTKGTPVPVVGGAVTESIDLLLLHRSGGIAGMVTAAPGGDPVGNIRIDVWDADGGYFMRSVRTSSAGTFLVDLPARTYVLATDNSGGWINQIFDGIQCPVGSAYNGDCDPFTGDPLVVTDGNLLEGVNFVLQPSPALFADGFDSGSTVRWSTTAR